MNIFFAYIKRKGEIYSVQRDEVPETLAFSTNYWAGWVGQQKEKSAAITVFKHSLICVLSASPRPNTQAVNVSANHNSDLASTICSICSQCSSISYLALFLKCLGPEPGRPLTYENEMLVVRPPLSGCSVFSNRKSPRSYQYSAILKFILIVPT